MTKRGGERGRWWQAGWVKLLGAMSAIALATTVIANLVTIGWLEGSSESGAEKPAAEEGSPVVATDVCEGAVIRGIWGPGREQFTLQQPAPHPTLNSISDNPN